MTASAAVQIADSVSLLLRGDLVCFLAEQDRLTQDEQGKFSIAGLEVRMIQQEVNAGAHETQAPCKF